MSATKTPNILQRLNAVQHTVSHVAKERKSGMKYDIVSHDAVTALVRPPLVDNGVVYYPVAMDTKQDGNRTEVVLTVRFCSIDDKEDFIDVVSLGYGVDAQDKGPGKAISYAVKYALLKTLGLETGDDPDKHQGQEAEYRAPKQPAPSKDTEARAVYSTLQEDMRRNKTKQEARRWWNDADVKELRKQIPADWDLTLKQELADLANGLADETAPGHISTIQAGE